jgi:phosphatidate cytidylyltransferase
MAGRSRFGRKRDDKDDEGEEAPPAKPREPQGVRVLEPDQAVKAAAKDTAVKRRATDATKPSDPPMPDPAKPAIKLPLARAAGADSAATPEATPGPPAPAPTGQQRLIDPTGQVPVEATEVSIGQPTQGEPVLADAPPVEPPPDEPIELDPKPPRRGFRRKSAAPAAGSVAADDADGSDAEEPEPDDADLDRAEIERIEAADEEAAAPLLSVEPPTGEVQLPHWTEPATGEVPRIIIGDTTGEASQDAWDAFAGSSTGSSAGSTRYRDQHDSWDDASVADLVDDDAERLGALAADTDDQTQDDFLSFEDLDVPDLDQPVAPTRGSSRDPVRQGRAGRPTGSTPVVRTTKKVPPSPRSSGSGRGAREAGRPERGPEPEQPAARAGSERQGVSPPPRSRDTGENRRVVDRLGVAPAGPESGQRNWRVAALVGVPMAVVALVIFNLPRWFPRLGNGVAVALIIIVVFLCGSEFMAAVTTRRFKPLLPVGWAALIAMPLAAYHYGDVAIPMVLFLTVFVGFGFYLTGLAHERPLANLGVTFFTVVYVAMFGSFASLILRIGPVLVGDTTTEVAQGASILVLAITSAVLSDVGGALFGKLYGRRPFTPISPNKTIQGVLGGVVVSTVITGILALEFGPFHVQGFFFAFCCAVAAPLGDLAESLLKRDLGLKDMSELIPGHGGVLDRMDALLFVLPVAYYVTRLLLGPGLPFS